MTMRGAIGCVAVTLALATLAAVAGCEKKSPGTTVPARPETPAASAPIPDLLTPPPSAAEERQRMQKSLTDSGPVDAEWTKAVPDVFARWKDEARAAGAHTEFSQAKCFRDGCFVEAKYADIGDYQTSSQSLAESAVFQSWRGVKYRSPPEEAKDGTVTATWALLQPEQ